MQAIGVDSGYWDAHFKLMESINLSGYAGTSFNIIGQFVDWGDPNNKPFTGVFDGNGHTISNFTYSPDGINATGLFAYVQDANAEIRDLGLVAPRVDSGAGQHVGSLVGRNSGIITNCYVKGGSISGNYNVGGLVGYTDGQGTISNCYTEGVIVAGDNAVGGLAGKNHQSSTISDCYSRSRVSGNGYVGALAGFNMGTIVNCNATGTVEGGDSAGGLVGYNHNPIINCFASTRVLGDSRVGGLVGSNWGATIADCYATGSVSGNEYVGGLAGVNVHYWIYGIIINCYSEGHVSGNNYVGGLLGSNGLCRTSMPFWCEPGRVSYCYSTGSVSGTSDKVGGLVGYNAGGDPPATVSASFWDTERSGQASSAAGTGKTTAEMKSASTFIGWGCETSWMIDNGRDYPRLWWENAPGESISKPTYGGGSGEPNDPYLIYTSEQFNTIGLVLCDLDKHFKLCADIDLGDYTGDEFNIIGDDVNAFTGVFDGNGHTISNFTYSSDGINNIGLFGFIEEAEIKDVVLVEPNVEAASGRRVGALAGYVNSGIVTACGCEGGSVSGHSSVGGLVGSSGYLFISNDYYSNFYYCYSTASVSGGNYIGGLLGNNSRGTVSDCYARGNVWGSGIISGGLIGYDRRGTVMESYSTGAASSTGGQSGGLIGASSSSSTVWKCFWDVNSSGQDSSAGGKGKTTVEMQDPNTYIAWSCGSIWTIDAGNDYPRLWWENMPGTPLSKQLSDFLAGAGTEEEPYMIYTPKELSLVGAFECEWDKHFKLMADIDFSGVKESDFRIIGNKLYPFTGFFNGNNHTVSNLTLKGDSYIGLFGKVNDTNAGIESIGLIDPNIEGHHIVGPLVGSLANGSVIGCYVEGGGVRGQRLAIGGMLGDNSGFIYDCYSTCDVDGYDSVGGLVGYNRGKITNCYSEADVTGFGHETGGLVGAACGYISNSYAAGNVSGEYGVGGLVGGSHCREERPKVSNSYSIGSVSGIKYVGGLIGSFGRGEVFNCYSAASVSGEDYVGGLLGVGEGNYYTACFWDSDVNPDLNGIGNASDSNVIGLPTVDMQKETTFTSAGWDFIGEVNNGVDDIWTLCESLSYPMLWWECPPIEARMKLTPQTLNCAAKGKFIKAHITLPEEILPEDIDVNTPAVAEPMDIDSEYIKVVGSNTDPVRLEIGFGRRAFCEDLTETGEIDVAVFGYLTTGQEFYGTDIITIKRPPMIRKSIKEAQTRRLRPHNKSLRKLERQEK